MHGMFGTRPSIAAFSVTAPSLVLALVLAPSLASASTPADDAPSAHAAHAAPKVRRTARITDADPSREDHDTTDAPTCRHAKPAVEVVAGDESATFSLEKCDGRAIPASVEKLSVLARPAGTAKPKEPYAAHGVDIAQGVRRLDPRLAERLELVADHFRKEGETPRIVLVAGTKARSAGSYHASGRAIDFRIEGTDSEAVATFCKTVQDTGCGFYPNSGFVHMDVRDPGAGHVAWIDISKAGEAPKYVTSWPLPEEPAKGEGPKAEATKEANNADASKLPSLPAAVQVAPLEATKPEPAVAPKAAVTAPKSEPAAESTDAPVKKAHHRHRHHHVDHTI